MKFTVGSLFWSFFCAYVLIWCAYCDWLVHCHGLRSPLVSDLNGLGFALSIVAMPFIFGFLIKVLVEADFWNIEIHLDKLKNKNNE